jgi:multidrug efflux pump subunit AcrB
MKECNPTESNSSGLIAWFASNHVIANILMGFLVIGGAISLLNMRSETFPAIDPNLITVSVVYPGATPYEVSEIVTSRVEDALIGIEGVKQISSSAREGFGTVFVQIRDFADGKQVYNDVETAVSGLSSFPPEDAERPVINRIRVTPGVMTLVLHGDVPESTLRFWGDRIREDLQRLDGVGLTSLRGIREREISIEVSENKLRDHNLSLHKVSEVVRGFSSDTPAGNIESGQGEILLRVQERRTTGIEFETVPLRTLEDGSILYLADVATINDGFADINLVSRFNGDPAAFIDIKRSASQDTLTVAETIKNYLSTVSLPKGLSLSIEHDETVILKDRMNLMIRNAILGFVLVFILLLLFLDLKLAVWTSVAIPVSFLGGMMVLHFLGYSLNMISLFALIVILGIVVDDGVVTGESIFNEQENSRGDKRAVIRGVRAVIAPVTIGVVTTIAAFAPLLFSTGAMGQLVGIIPVVVIPILLISLLEAYFILPAHLSSPSRWSLGIIATLRDKLTAALAQFTDRIVVPAAHFCIRWRYATVAGFLALGILTGGLVQGGKVRFLFFPEVEGDTIGINLKMPIGTPFDLTRATVNEIEQVIEQIDNDAGERQGGNLVKSVSTSMGALSQIAGGPIGRVGTGATGGHLAEITVQLVSSDARDLSAAQIESMIRDKVQYLPGIEELTFRSSLAGNDPDLEIELSHPEDTKLIDAAEMLGEALVSTPGTINVSTSHELGKTEYVFRLNEQGLAVGLTPQDLGRQLRASYFGHEVQRIQRDSSEVIVYVRYPKEERERVSSLDNMRVRLPNGPEVALSTVTDRVQQYGFSQIETVNGRRVLRIMADADLAQTTPNEIIANLESTILPGLMLDFPGLEYTFAGETRDQDEDLDSLMQNMLIALMLIYIILGGLLRSYLQPLVIMAAIPFGVIGAVFGHLFLGYDLTFISLFGLVALSGVVVNDSVVLLDYLNKQQIDGKGLTESALLAVRRRFRPILLTTLSTSIGLLPMLLETSMQAQFLIPMVVSLATGILFATPIILVLVPCLTIITEDVKRLLMASSIQEVTNTRTA